MTQKIWLTADWHLGEDRFELMQRPFDNVQTHIDTLVDNHNKVVAPDDLVYVNGDVVYQKANPDYLTQIARFNGEKILIRGNHDRVFTDEQFAPYFKEIIPEGKGVDLDIDNLPCYITHYPSLGREDRFNLIGHIHSAFKYQLNMFNVGVDANHFCPVDSNSIHFHYTAVCKFYDDDVWVAYNEINSKFVGLRGKKGNYFNPQ